MGRRLNISHSTVINTELAPLTESFWLEPNGQTEQWYYENTRTFAPDRQITPLIITPRISAEDTESGTSYTPLFANIAWTVLQWNGSAYAETTITNVVDTTEHDYVIIGNTLKVNKNNSEATHGITIKCNATYIDPRDSGVVYTVIDELLLTTNRDATLIYPKINILAESARGYNPLRDQSSLFSFKAAADWSDIPSVHSAPMEFNDDADGTEEIVPQNESQVQTVAPIMDIRYGSNVLENQRFMLRPTGGDVSVSTPDDVAFIDSIKGKTVKWNQIAPDITTNISGTYGGSTDKRFIVGNRKSFSVTNSMVAVKNGADVYFNKYFEQINSDIIQGNIYYISLRLSVSAFTYFRYTLGYRFTDNKNISKQLTKYSIVLTAGTSNKTLGIWFGDNYGTRHGSYIVKDFIAVDLTQLFGAGNEPATAADFETWIKENFGDWEYFEQCGGSLESVKANGLKTLGFNQYNPTTGLIKCCRNKQYQITGTYADLYFTWDNESVTFNNYTYGNAVELAQYYTNGGKKFLSADYIDSYNAEDTYSVDDYCIYNSQIYKCTTAISTAEEWNADHWTLVPDFAAMVSEGIFTMVSITPDANGIFTPTERYIHVEGGNATDTCVHLVNSGARNGDYEPYRENTKALPITTMQGRLNGTGELVTIFPDGLKSAGTVYDEIKVENGVVKAIKRIGSVDLGTLDWGKDNYVFSIYIIDRKITTTAQTPGAKIPYIISNDFVYDYDLTVDNSISFSSGRAQTWIRCDSYSNAAAFKSAMSGVMLYYELATPLEYVVENLPRGTFEWYGVSDGNEVLIETLPCYVSGQHTDTLVVDAMYGENISVVLRIKNLGWDDAPMPPKESRNVAWRIPPLESLITCDEGNAVRSTSGDFNFGTIVNMNGETIDAERKAGHLRFHWNSRKCDLSTVVDRGWGQEVKIPAYELRNNPTQANTIASSIVGNEVYMLGAYEEVTHNNEAVTHNGQKVYERTTV